MKIQSNIGSWIFDSILCGLLWIWVWGGVNWNSHLYLSHGADLRRAAIIWGLSGYFLFPTLRRRSITLRGIPILRKYAAIPRVQWATLLLCFIFSVATSIAQCLALRVTLYDVGIFHQILWSLKHGFGFHSTISGAGNFLMDHFSPSLALLLPFFYLSGDHPLTFPVIQNLLIFGGSSAWLYFASKVSGVTQEFRGNLGAAVVVFIMSFDSLWRNVGWGFHENAIAFCSLSWAIAFLLASENQLYPQGARKVGVFFLLLVTAVSKETLLLDIAIALCLWGVVEFKTAEDRSKSTIKAKFFPFFLALIAMVLIFVFIYFEKLVHPADKNYFNRYYSYLANDLEGFSFRLIRYPFLVIQTIGAGELLKYFWTVFSYWLFLPLLLFIRQSNRRAGIWILVLVPSLGSAALSTFSALRRPEFHYVLELWPVLGVLTILFLARQKSVALVWIWAGFSLLRMDYDPIAKLREFRFQSKDMSDVRLAFHSLPVEAIIAADELTGPWLAGRKWVSRWPDTTLLPGGCPDYWVVLNTPESEKARLFIQKCNSPVLFWKKDNWSIYRFPTS